MAARNRTKLTGSWRLFLAALRQLRSDWKRYALILAAVTLPTNLLALIGVDASNDRASGYLVFVTIIMNVALLHAMVVRRREGRLLGLAEAYYDGTAPLLRYVVVSFNLVIMLIPALFGAFLYALGLVGVGVSGVFSAEQILIGTVTTVLFLVTGHLLVRYNLAPIIAIRDHLRPIAALRRSRQVTLGRFWAVVGRLVMLLVWLTLASVPATLIALLLAWLGALDLGLLLFSILSTFIALPLANLYLLELYDALAGRMVGSDAPANV